MVESLIAAVDWPDGDWSTWSDFTDSVVDLKLTFVGAIAGSNAPTNRGGSGRYV
jgi:hypothetical protein